MHFGNKREMKHTKIEIIPMIDTMFFLLVFFVLASLNIIDLRGLNLDLPPAVNGPAPKVDPKEVKLEIAIDKVGNKTVTGTAKQAPIKTAVGKSASDALLKVIAGQLGRGPSQAELDKITLIISPDLDTAHENLISAVDDAREAHLEKFSIR